jgi:hypothetical protein
MVRSLRRGGFGAPWRNHSVRSLVFPWVAFFINDILDTALRFSPDRFEFYCPDILPFNEASTSLGRPWPQTQADAF